MDASHTSDHGDTTAQNGVTNGPILHLGIPITDPSSPFFIHPSENWGQSLVSQALNESNFCNWERSMILVLDGKNKLGFLNGKIKQPDENSPLYEPWNRNNKLLLSWIQRSVNSTIVESILYITTAVGAWKELTEQFSQGDSFRIHYKKTYQ